MTDAHAEAIDLVPERAWTPAYDADGQVRDGAWVTEITDLLDLSSWPKGMRVVIRKERPHPGAQLRFTDRDGLRLTAFVTNTRSGQLPDLELRHRRRARCEDRIRAAKVTGLQNLPLHGFDQNRIWLALVQLACELLAWMDDECGINSQYKRSCRCLLPGLTVCALLPSSETEGDWPHAVSVLRCEETIVIQDSMDPYREAPQDPNVPPRSGRANVSTGAATRRCARRPTAPRADRERPAGSLPRDGRDVGDRPERIRIGRCEHGP